MKYALLIVLLASHGALAQRRASPGDLAAQVEEVARQVEAARNSIKLVENQYTLRDEASEEAQREQRFSDGEIAYLLNDHSTAAVLFYDLVANRDFQRHRRYGDALFYLSDSLYQQKNYLGARLYLRQLLNLREAHYKEALARYLEIAGRLNEFSGIDDYISQARAASGGALPPELSYVYGKWLFRRGDLSMEERVRASAAVFAPLAHNHGGPFYLQARYFLGVGAVKLKLWEEAAAHFASVVQEKPREAREKAVVDLAYLSQGRVLFELAKYDEAIDRYAHVTQDSDSFPDALYEQAWCFVRKGELEKAHRATEVLLLVAHDSVLAPEAQILQATLLQKLSRYDEAIDAYQAVIDAWAPVYAEIDALLKHSEDPVQYFDELLSRNDKTLDVTQLLPAAALKWAGTKENINEAVQITGAIDLSRKGLEESHAIADRILKSLEERGVESFPILQEGYTRADAVDTQLTRSEAKLTLIEEQLVAEYLSDDQQTTLRQLKAQQAALKTRIDTLPSTDAQVRARKERMQAAIDAIDRQAFSLSIEAHSQSAQITALRKYVDDTRLERRDTPEDKANFNETVTHEQASLDALLAELDELRVQLVAEKNNADKAVGGEGQLKADYAKLLEQERQVLYGAREAVSAGVKRTLLRADVVRSDVEAVRERVQRSKDTVRARVVQKAERLKAQVLAEQTLLETYRGEAGEMTGQTRQLVGNIAYESFKRVRQSFYDLVLKADVGLVDVSFQRKQDKTTGIQQLSAQKDRELKQLDDEFKEVLQDVE